MGLRKITFKDGRAPIHVLSNGSADPQSNVQGEIRRHASLISDMSEANSELAGFAIIGMFTDGRTSMGYRMPAHIPRALMAAYLTEVIQRDVLIEQEARDVFDSMFAWVD